MPEQIISASGAQFGLIVNSEGRALVQSKTNLDISEGVIPNYRHINKFGRNPTIPADTKEAIWDVGGKYPFLSGAETLQIVSSSIKDTTAGLGAREIAISGLDANYVEISETISLNGTTEVFTGSEYLRLNRMFTTLTGGSEFNIGSIDATGSITSTPQARISPEEGQTLMAVYTIPSGTTGFITNYNASFDEGGAGVNPNLVDIDLTIRPSGNGFRVNNHQGLISTGTTRFQHFFDPPLVLDAKTDVLINAIPTIADTDLHAGFDIILKDT